MPRRGETSHRVFHFLPDGRHFLYGTSGQRAGIYAASLDGGAARDVLAGVTAATFAPPDYLLFNRQQTLMAQRFDVSTLERRGSAAPIAEQIAGGAFSASDEGTLVYRAGSSRGSQLAWIDRDGRHIGDGRRAGLLSAGRPVSQRIARRRAAHRHGYRQRGHLGGRCAHRHLVAPDARPRARCRPRVVARRADDRVHDLSHGLRVRSSCAISCPARKNRSSRCRKHRPRPGTDSGSADVAGARANSGGRRRRWLDRRRPDAGRAHVRTSGLWRAGAGDRVARLLVDTPYVEDQTQCAPTAD